MRTATVAALVLVSACGSSSPEVAPPAPAAAPAVAADAARPSMVATEQDYDIDGSSVGALRDQINRLGPKDESGKSRDALTVWSIEWAYTPASRPDGCVLRDVKVTLNVAVTLPRWKPPATASPEVVRSWQTYLKAVRLHEAGHRAIAERNARDVMAALLPLRGANCDHLSDQATRTAEQIVADGRARNRAYDVDTKHGQTQGVVLQP
jgi:predicted secreted Zn-dependent protease